MLEDGEEEYLELEGTEDTEENQEELEKLDQESSNAEKMYYILGVNEDGSTFYEEHNSEQNTNPPPTQHQTTVIKCPICGQNFINLRKLKRHFLNHKAKTFKISNVETSQCKICFDRFETYALFLQHANNKHLRQYLDDFDDN